MYLTRHAHAEWRDDEARPLSASGVEAAQLVADRLARQPIAAIYSSPSQRAIETVTPLADRLGLRPVLLPALRERALPVVTPAEFPGMVLDAWRRPEIAPRGGESNVTAQTRGLAVITSLLRRHAGEHVVAATHGNLLALVLNGFDPAFGYEFWYALSFPDIYRLAFDANGLVAVDRFWD